MLTIRLSRAGAKKRPFFHITVADSRKPRDGRFVERVGFFNPIASGKEVRLDLNHERLDYWVSKGAQISDRVLFLMKQEKESPEQKAKREEKKEKKRIKKASKKASEKATATVAPEEAAPEEAAKEEAAPEEAAPEEAAKEEAAKEEAAPEEAAPEEGAKETPQENDSEENDPQDKEK